MRFRRGEEGEYADRPARLADHDRDRTRSRAKEASMHFPLPFVPKVSYKGGNGFDASRDKVRKGLVHAANDLAAIPGTPVLSMDEGVVLRGPYNFFFDTSAIEIKHPRFIARYCEIDPTTEVRAGDKVKEGQVIAYVGDQPGDDMLHLEFFLGNKSGDLSFQPGTHPPYDRRDDVFNGVKFLDWSVRTAHFEDDPSIKYRFIVDKDGAKFIDERGMDELQREEARQRWLRAEEAKHIPRRRLHNDPL
jgi:murein DD-endopeptidase MepM/ murein hydrolase activator NlpD